MNRAIAVAAAVAALVAVVAVLTERGGPFGPERQAETGRVPIGGAFTLVDGDGRTWSDSTFRGRPMLVSFGYTYCPDICPTTLQTIADALDVLGESGEAIQPLFVTVDPERDTPGVVGAYVDHFHDRLIGLSGSVEQVAAAARAYRVALRKVPQTSGDYLMDHTTIVYLMGPDGAYVTHFSHTEDAGSMAAKLAEYLEATT